MSTPSNQKTKSQIPSQFTFSLDTPSLSSSTLDGYLKTILGTDSTHSLPEMFISSGDFKPLTNNSTSNTLNKDTTTSNPPVTLHKIIEEKEGLSSTSTTNSQKDTDEAPPVVVSLKNETPISSSQIPQQQQTSHQQTSHELNDSLPSFQISQLQQQQQRSSPQREVIEHNNDSNILPIVSSHLQSGAMITTENSTDLIPMPRGQSYVDITDYLNMPQADAAKKLGIPASTLSKRWKEAVRKRKWPYRMICKIDKEIMTLLHNVPQGPNAPPLPPEIETALGLLLRKRQEELRSVVIRL